MSATSSASASQPTISLVDRVRAGDARAAARLMTGLDDGLPAARAALRALFPFTGRAYVIGLTGAPGVGKSSLTDRLITHYRSVRRNVGVVAIDATSPFSGGAILGDRIRMQDHATDSDVFIRSVATRGHLGGLSRATADVVHVLDAMGKQVVLVETVGAGQQEVEVAELAHTVVVVAAPGLGDDIQAMKAGVVEIGDVFAVNKADRDGAERVVRELQAAVQLRWTETPSSIQEGPAPAAVRGVQNWEPPIVKTVAARGDGVEDLADAIERHRAQLERTGQRWLREVARARAAFLSILREQLAATALKRLSDTQGELDDVAKRIAAQEADPYALVDDLVARLAR